MTDPTQVTRDPMPAPAAHTRARLIRRRMKPRWDWYQIRKELALFVIVACSLIVGGNGLVRLLSDAPKPIVIDNRTDPDLIAQTYAMRVAQLFLTYDAADPDARAAAVAALVPGAPVTLGWDGRGKSTATVIGPLSDTPQADPGVRQIAVYVVANGTPRTVIVRVRKDAAGVPSLVGVPTLAAAPRAGTADQSTGESGATTGVDLTAANEARPTVVGFLSAWGAGDPAQSVYAADGFKIPPGPGGLKLDSQPVFTMPNGDTVRTFVVYVRWATSDPAVTYPSAYQMTLVRGQQRWSVQSIGAAPTGAIASVPS